MGDVEISKTRVDRVGGTSRTIEVVDGMAHPSGFNLGGAARSALASSSQRTRGTQRKLTEGPHPRSYPAHTHHIASHPLPSMNVCAYACSLNVSYLYLVLQFLGNVSEEGT